MQHLHVMPCDYRSATSLFEHVMRELQRMQLSHVIVEMMLQRHLGRGLMLLYCGKKNAKKKR